jgi:hypothetical protein
VVHAAVNTTALTLYSASLVTRLRGGHRTAVVLAVAGGLTATAGGWVGGHLSLVRKIGTSDPAFAETAAAGAGASRRDRFATASTP